MSPERRIEICRMGGIAAHKKGTAHEYTSDEAKKAGTIGGHAAYKKLGREHYSEMGRKGGTSSKKKAS